MECWVSGKLPLRKLPPLENYPPENCPLSKYPLWISPLRKLSPVKITPQKVAPRKLPTGKITPNEIPSPLINHKNERKNKVTKLFTLKKTVQDNILIKITKFLFDTQMISQKILGLIERKRKSPSGIYLTVVRVKEN